MARRFSFYQYEPSIPAAAVFLACFAISTVVHILQLVRRRTWYFIPFVVGGLFEAVGYVGRIMSALEAPDYTRNPYIVQALLLLIAPALFAASIYMILGRIVRLVEGEHYSVIRVEWLTKIFVAADVVCFLLQGAGGGILATAENDPSKYDLGENVIIAGIFVQLIGFAVFVVVAAIFHRRILRNPTTASQEVQRPWQRYLYVLYAVSILILVRSVFRSIEYIQGYDSYLQSKEVFLYVFDGVLMLAAMVILNIFHPSSIIAGRTGRSKLNSATGSEVEMAARGDRGI